MNLFPDNILGNEKFDFDNFVPIECKAYPGYYYVPYYPTIVVTRDGDLIDLPTRKKTVDSKHRPKGNENPKYYRNVIIPGFILPSGRPMTVGLHRLVMLAFSGRPPKNIEYPMVNHKDGDKWNNCIDNLEWIDFSGNIDHAYRTGLRTDNVHVLAKNLRTGEEKEWHSFGDCAKFFGVHPERPFSWSLTPDKVFKKEWIFKRKNDPRPWPNIKWYPGYKNDRINVKPIIGVNYKLGICVFGDSAPEVANIANVSIPTITAGIRKHGVYSHKDWFFKYKDDPNPLPMNEIESVGMTSYRITKPVQAYNPDLKVCYFANSIAEMARMTGVDRYKLKDRLKTKNKFGSIGGWYYRFPDSTMPFPYLEQWDNLKKR